MTGKYGQHDDDDSCGDDDGHDDDKVDLQLLQLKLVLIFIYIFFSSNNCIVPLGFLDRKFGFLSPEKASCDRVALPNLQCMLGV